MIYLELIDRDRTMPVELFRHLGDQGSSWAEGAEDRMILQLGRTLRLGPMPSYLCLWEIPDLARLDSWEDYFHSDAALENRRSRAMHRAIHIQRAGLYDMLDRAPDLNAPLYLVEYADPLELSDEGIRAALAERAHRHGDLCPILTLRRVGRAGPSPALLAFWGAPSHAALEAILRDDRLPGMSLVDIGVYRRFGEEIL
jgi:hypothetical protein